MPKALIITEKPSVAHDLVAALGGFKHTGSAKQGDEYWESDQYVCTYAVGHILELLEPEDIDAIYKRWVLDNLPIIPQEFKLKPKSGQTARVRTIKKLMQRKDIDSLVNGCDAGREGELIFREVVKYLESNKPIRRLWLQSMTPDAIRDGFARLQDGRKFDGLAAAAECRSIADWLIGINASRAMTVRMRSRANKQPWSTGRVQTPTLALLVDREHEILSHVPEPYWRIVATFAVGGADYAAVWFDPDFKDDESRPQAKADRIFHQDRAMQIVAKVTGKPAIATETRKPSRESAPPLFDLTSLQREANRRFGWSAARTLQAAQRCYEAHKALTYPRTDSRCLPSDYVAEVEKVFKKLASVPDYSAAARRLLQNGRENDHKIFNDAGVSDHFAIIPTGQIPSSLGGDDARLFDFVTRRFLGAFHPPAVWEQVERTTLVEGEHFASRARTLRELGWRAVLEQQADDSEAKGLPQLVTDGSASGEVSVQTQHVAAQAEQTRPPPRITEARLLSLMENAGKLVDDEDLAAVLHEKGLGTPATRADTIENLKSKGYVDRSLRPTVKGMRLIDLLHRINVSRLTSAELTGEIELHLNEVERGKRTRDRFLGEVIDYTKEVVEAARTFNFSEIFPDEHPLGTCPCPLKRPVFERSWFYRCQEDHEKIEAENDCPFRIWKDKSGRFIDRNTAETLLRDGKTGELDGFLDRRGRTYKGCLEIADLQVVLHPIAGSEQSGPNEPQVQFEVNPEPLGPCPIHKDEPCQVVESPTEYICQNRLKQIEAGARKPIGVVLPRVVCKRVISRDEAVGYITTGETALIEDFISRYDRPFKAKLKLGPDGRRIFEFPPRNGQPRRRKHVSKASDTSARSNAKKKAAKKATTKASAKRSKTKRKVSQT